MTANEALDLYLCSLDSKERAAKSRDIRALCQKSRSVLYDWRKGRSRIESFWRDKITEAIGKDIFVNVTN
ncbi:MAG: hypothetical protein K2M49_02750 [Muribaculaceae bacterium]|nr:hypothetical protein [Muribaculaceae bacterium]